jgi:hypothetical protein
MKIIKFNKKLKKDLLFNVMLSFVIMLVVLDAVPSTNSLEFRSKTHAKNKKPVHYVKKNDYYYKNKYEEFPDEPIVLEKSSKKTKDGFILPVLKVPAYKTVIPNKINENSNINSSSNLETSKLSESTDNISEGVKLASTENYSNDKDAQFRIASEVDDVYAESTNANEIAKSPLFDNTVKKYQEYRSAGILVHGLVREQKNKFDIKKKLSEEIDSEEDETTKKSNKVLNNLIDSQKQSLKLNSTDDLKKYLVNLDHNKNFDSNKKNNIYFAENDVDYAVDKKIRETNEVQPDAFVSHNLTHNQEKNNDINFIETKSKQLEKNEENKSQQNTNDLRLRNKLDHLLESLKKKIYDNPKDYDFYFKDTIYDFKHFLVNERIIEPTSYHVDDSSNNEKNNDFEKLKKLDNIEKQILKENNDKKKNARINNDKNDINNIEDALNNRLSKEKLAIINLKNKKTIVFEKITEKHKDEHKDVTVSKNKTKIVKSGNNEEEEDSLISKIRNEIFEQENGKKYNNNLFSDEHYKNEHKINEKEIKKPAIKIEKLKAKLLNENSISAQNSIESKLIKDQKEVKNSTEDHIKSIELNNHSFVQKNLTKNSSIKKSKSKSSEEVEGESVLSELLKSMK